jgi:hypothetical protein
MRLALAAWIFVIMAEVPSHAATVIGAGVDPCGRWLADTAASNSPQALQDEQWVLGYLSAVGQHGGPEADPLKAVDASAVWTWIDHYCRANPSAHIADAAEAFNVTHLHRP